MSIGIKLVAMAAVVFAAAVVAAAFAAAFIASCALLTRIHRMRGELFTDWCLVIGEILLSSSLPVARKKCHSARSAKAASLVCSDKHIL
jgi:hypothetical protein